MSTNNSYDNELDQFGQLSESVARGLYQDRFDAHLQRFMSIDFTVHRLPNELPLDNLDLRRYMGWEQTAFEMSDQYEKIQPLDIPWTLVDEARAKFNNKLKEVMGEEYSSDYLFPFIRWTTNNFENYYIYKKMYPESRVNPWRMTQTIVSKGLLFFLSHSYEQINEYKQHLKSNSPDQKTKRLGIIVKGKGKSISGLITDDRYNHQTKVFKYLYEQARGLDNSKSLDQINEFLQDQGIEYNTTNDIQVLVTTPLKKTGMIGSTMKGFFYIESKEDLIAAFRFHFVKSKSIYQVMDRYRQRQKEFGELDLDSEVEGE